MNLHDKKSPFYEDRPPTLFQAIVILVLFFGTIAVILIAGIAWAFAQPVPPPPSGAYMEPEIGAWFSHLVNTRGGSCCSIADCRPTSIRLVPNPTPDGPEYEVLIDEHFPNNDHPGWKPVPRYAYVPNMPNPIGRPVACWWGGAVQCLVREADG